MIQNNIEESCNLINPDSDHRVNILRIAHKCVRFFPKIWYHLKNQQIDFLMQILMCWEDVM
jgi:hypothetical protein